MGAEQDKADALAQAKQAWTWELAAEQAKEDAVRAEAANKIRLAELENKQAQIQVLLKQLYPEGCSSSSADLSAVEAPAAEGAGAGTAILRSIAALILPPASPPVGRPHAGTS